jgi:mono/diheme cytochrome c family protein
LSGFRKASKQKIGPSKGLIVENRWKMIILAGAAAFWLAACTSPASDSGDRPADHTVNKAGAYHKTGLNDPLANCVSCHGADLRGGTAGVSCFKCHGQKW